jgi:hypothetical protein
MKTNEKGLLSRSSLQVLLEEVLGRDLVASMRPEAPTAATGINGDGILMKEAVML